MLAGARHLVITAHYAGCAAITSEHSFFVSRNKKRGREKERWAVASAAIFHPVSVYTAFVLFWGFFLRLGGKKRNSVADKLKSTSFFFVEGFVCRWVVDWPRQSVRLRRPASTCNLTGLSFSTRRNTTRKVFRNVVFQHCN